MQLRIPEKLEKRWVLVDFHLFGRVLFAIFCLKLSVLAISILQNMNFCCSIYSCYFVACVERSASRAGEPKRGVRFIRNALHFDYTICAFYCTGRRARVNCQGQLPTGRFSFISIFRIRTEVLVIWRVRKLNGMKKREMARGKTRKLGTQFNNNNNNFN